MLHNNSTQPGLTASATFLACASECEKHSDNPHCQKCAEACRRAAEEYRKVATIAGVA